jgi:hypothetical protein
LNHFAGPGSDEDIAFFFAACLGYIGAVVALVSSIISKPRFFGTVATIVGLFYIFSFYGYFVFVSSVGVASKVVLMVLPGVALIGGGIVLARISSTPIAKGKKGY